MILPLEKHIMDNFDLFLDKCNNKIQHIFERQKTPTSFWLKQVSQNICVSSTAKRIRPRLIYFFHTNMSSEIPSEKILDIAIISELFHSASLLHDDVIDNSSRRRNQDTAHYTTSIPTAILTGDWLYSYALTQILLLKDMFIYKSALEMIMLMSEAAILEQEKKNTLMIIDIEWEQIAYGKTGALLSWSIQSLLLLLNKKELLGPFLIISKKLGLIFQIFDDLYDFYPQNKKKSPFEDLQNKNPNYLIIQALKNNAFQQKITHLYSDHNQNYQELGIMIWESKIPQNAIQKTQTHLQDIKAILHKCKMDPLYEDIKKWLKKSSSHIPYVGSDYFSFENK